jgi:aminopeptidase N
MIEFFASKIGVRYPYDQYAQICVSDYIMGGMEHTTATTLTDTFLPDESVMPEWEGRSLIAHELAHQWFGDLLTCRDWSHGWLNEGFATYFDALWHEHARGVDEFRYMMYQNAQEYLSEDSKRYRRPIVERTYQQPIDIFDRHLYPKGAWVLHMIRSQLGDEGWWRAIHHYVERHREQTVITSDLERAIEEVTGINLEKFFDQWIFTGGHPEFRVGYSWDEERRILRLDVEQKQQVDRLTPIFDLPVDLLVEVDGQEQRLRVHVDEPRHTFFIPLSCRPRRVRFDPEDTILKTLDFPRPHDLLAYQLEHDPDVSGRIEAAVELGKKVERRGVEALAAALGREPFWGVTVEIARALGGARTPTAKQALLGALTHADPRVRSAVAEQLGQFKHDDEVAQAFVTRLREGDSSPHVIGELVKSLGGIKAPGTLAAARSLLEQPSWNDVIRCGALGALGALDDPGTLPLIQEWTQYGRSPQARIAAITALGTLGKQAEPRQAAVECLVDLLDDRQLRVKNAAAQALGIIGDKTALPALERTIDRARHGSTIRVAREAARTIREERAQSDELAQLRTDLDKLAGENRTLRDRVDMLEQTSRQSGTGI